MTLADIATEPMIGYDPLQARYFFDLIHVLFRCEGYVPRFVQYLVHAHSALALVAASLGVALVPASAAVLRFRGVTFREIELGGEYAVDLHVLWHADNTNPIIGVALERVFTVIEPALATARG